MSVSPHDRSLLESRDSTPSIAMAGDVLSHSLAGGNGSAIHMLDGDEPEPRAGDPGTVILTCANCGAEMIERKCKLICRCGYFLSCSDYY
jgi:hypothetical protein